MGFVLVGAASACAAAALVDRLWAVRRVGPVGAAAVAAAAAVVVAPAWATTLEQQTTPRGSSPAAQAAAWVAESVPRGDQLIVDNTAWVDLVERGFPARNVVWFWKLDLDPGVSDLYPGGYRAFDYVLLSDIMRASEQAPVTKAAIEHSCVVATFGSGETRVEVRRIGNAEKTRCGDAKP